MSDAMINYFTIKFYLEMTGLIIAGLGIIGLLIYSICIWRKG